MMTTPESIKVKDPMTHDQNGKSKTKECCCYVWFGRKVKKEKSIPNTDGPEFDVRNFIEKQNGAKS